MLKKLPNQSGRKQWTYTCKSMHYVWSTTVIANSIKEARRLGYLEAKRIMGNHARIHSDHVQVLA